MHAYFPTSETCPRNSQRHGWWFHRGPAGAQTLSLGDEVWGGVNQVPARDPRPDLEWLTRIAYAVDRAVGTTLRSPRRGDPIGMGADGSPTELLDQVAEREVLRELERWKLPWNLLSEEAGHIDRGGESLLVLDPVDGSHNAVHGIPFFTVSLALGTRSMSDVRAGVVHDLVRGVTYAAIREGGAWANGRRLGTRTWTPGRDLFFVNLGAHSTPRAHAVASIPRRTRALGCASLELCLVAEGAGDAYFCDNAPPSKNLRVTDLAAAQLILREAGGGVSEGTGREELDLPLELTHRSSVFAWGDRSLRDHGLEGEAR